MQYSGFGRPTKGQKKGNFSETTTFMILKGKYRHVRECWKNLYFNLLIRHNSYSISCYRSFTTKFRRCLR